MKIFLVINKKPPTGSCYFFVLVDFDELLGNLQLAFFNQREETFPLTSNLVRYESYATKYCTEQLIEHLPEMD